MRASRTDYSRQIDYSAATARFPGIEGLQNQIIRRLRKRKNGMTIDQLIKWFAATNEDFILHAIWSCISDGDVIADESSQFLRVV